MTRLTRSTIIGIFSRVISFCGSFFLIRLMLAHLGNTNYGIWITISSSVGLFSFMDLGLGNTLVNALARAGSDKGQVNGYIKLAFRFQVAFSGIVLLLFTLAFRFINWGWIFDIRHPVPGLLCTIFLTGVFFLLSLVSNTIYAIQRGMQRTDLANTWQLISSVCYLFSLWMALSFSANLEWIALATFGVPVLVAVVNGIWYIRKEQLIVLSSSAEVTGKRDFFKVSTLFLYLQVAALIAFQTDALIIAHLLHFDDVAKYNLTAKVFTVPIVLVGIRLQNLWPVYASSSSISVLKKRFLNELGRATFLTFVFCLAVYGMRETIFSLWLNGLIDVPQSLVLGMAVWTVLNCIDMHVATLLNSLNLLKLQVILSVLMISSNIALSILLGRRLGVQGVVWATVVSTLLFSTLPMLYYLLKSAFNPQKAYI